MGLNTEDCMNADYENMKSTWLKTVNSTCVYACYSVCVLGFGIYRLRINYFFLTAVSPHTKLECVLLFREVCVIKAVIFSRWHVYVNIFSYKSSRNEIIAHTTWGAENIRFV